MSLEERHWPSLCIIALLLALSVAVLGVCADAMPVIKAVLNSAIAIYLDFMVSSIVNRNNTGCSALVPLVGKGSAPCGWIKAADGIGSAARTIRALDRFKRLLRSSIAVQMRRWTLNGYMALIRSTSRTRAD